LEGVEEDDLPAILEGFRKYPGDFIIDWLTDDSKVGLVIEFLKDASSSSGT
jgi:hypothetical protein